MTALQFSSVVRAISQATNRSLAGSRFFVHQDFCEKMPENFVNLAQEWGMRLFFAADDRPSCDIELHADYAVVDSAKIFYETSETSEISETSEHDSHSNHVSASEQIDLAFAGMPVVRRIADEMLESGILRGERIAVSLIIEPKTAVLLLELQRAGAQVGVYATAAEVHQSVADELKKRGIAVFADSRWSPEQEHTAALQLLDELRPTIIIDDGASFARLASLERPDLLPLIKGVAEETTSGVRAFTAMEEAGALSYPVIASNDSQLKTGFDNVHGTGESCVTTFLHIMGDNYPHNSGTMAVIGFGPVGRGFARRMRSLGAHVVIVEQSATAALKAQFEGFEVMPMAQTAQKCDCLISATGVVHTIDMDTLSSIADGTVLGVIGGIAHEIALDNLTRLTGQNIAPAIPLTQLDLGNGRFARLIASGDGMNYTVSGGNPIEIMDLSFSVQLNAVRMLATQSEELGNHVIRMDSDIDETIARSALAARGAQIDDKRVMVSDWTRTRFNSYEPSRDSASSASTDESAQNYCTAHSDALSTHHSHERKKEEEEK